MREAIIGCIVGEFIAIVPADALKGADPDKAFTVLVNTTHRIGNKSILYGEWFKKHLLRKRANKNNAKENCKQASCHSSERFRQSIYWIYGRLALCWEEVCQLFFCIA